MSYSHQHDRVLAPGLQSGLQRFARPWYRPRALRIFRDTADLAASPALWPSIEKALEESRWFILLASPEAAGSVWVNREVRWWLGHRSADRLLIVGTAPGLAWDEQRYDWAAGAPVPPALRGGVLRTEPLWVDLSDLRADGHAGLIPDERIAAMAAPIRGVPKDALVGEHLRLRRRAMRLVGGTIAFLLALAVGLAAVTVLAVEARETADQQRDLSLSRLWAIQSQGLGDANPVLAKQEALASWRIAPSVQGRYAMLNAATTPGTAVFTTGKGINALAFGSDGTTLAAASEETGTAERLDAATGRQIGRPFRAQAPGTGGLDVFTPSARILAATGPDFARVWNVITGQQIGKTIDADDPYLASATLSADGTTFAEGGFDGKAFVWNVATGQQMGGTLAVTGGGKDFVLSVALTSDGKILATADADGTVQLWDTATGQRIGGPLATSVPQDMVMAFSPDGETLAVGGNQSISLFNVPARTMIGSPLASGWVQSMAFSPDSTTLAAGDMDGTTMLWNVSTQRQVGSTLTGGNSSGSVDALAFSPDGTTLATGSEDGTIRLWNIGTEQPRSVSLPISPGSMMMLSYDGTSVAGQVSNGNGPFQLWDITAGRPIRVSFSASGSTYDLASFNGQYLAAELKSLSGTTVELWDVVTGHETTFHINPSPSAIAISPDGKMLADVAGDDAQLWSVATRHPIGRPFAVTDETIYSIAFSPDSKTLATGSTDDTARLWDVATHRPIGSPFTTSNWVMALAFSPDGSTLATGSADGTVRLWDLSTDEQIGAPLVTGTTIVGSLAFWADGKTLAVTIADYGPMQLWDVQYLVNTPQYLCGLLRNQSMTSTQWMADSSGVPYQNTCP